MASVCWWLATVIIPTKAEEEVDAMPSMRAIAKEMDISITCLSLMVNRERKWRSNLYQKCVLFVNTSDVAVNTFRQEKVASQAGFEPTARCLEGSSANAN